MTHRRLIAVGVASGLTALTGLIWAGTAWAKTGKQSQSKTPAKVVSKTPGSKTPANPPTKNRLGSQSGSIVPVLQKRGAVTAPQTGPQARSGPSAQPPAANLSGLTALQQRLHKMDTNGDGIVTRREFTGSQAEFDALDRNGDGKLVLSKPSGKVANPPAVKRQAVAQTKAPVKSPAGRVPVKATGLTGRAIPVGHID